MHFGFVGESKERIELKRVAALVENESQRENENEWDEGEEIETAAKGIN